ncbi:helix-turn-helix transcriptional regulator [Paenibacillaceae bacterium WGS1546]|uniref:helix-turn-helix transcriptional regulator n=1 Tax=Cohnella sp. WGS1546 TaxID=3366810 RepID=UPI00372D39A6
MTSRQQQILKIVEDHHPISGELIAERLNSTRPAIRADLAMLVMLNYLEAKPKVGYTLGRASERRKSADMERLLEMKVRDYQSAPVVIRETTNVGDAVVALFLEDVGTLFVTDDKDALTGVVSRKDLLRVTLGNASAAAMPIGLVMTRQPNIHTVAPEDTLLAAASKMIQHEVDSLPVVSASASADDPHKVEVVGRITKTTITKALLELALGN